MLLFLHVPFNKKRNLPHMSSCVWVSFLYGWFQGIIKRVRSTFSCPCGYVRFLRKRGGKKSYAVSKLDGIRRKEARWDEGWMGGNVENVPGVCHAMRFESYGKYTPPPKKKVYIYKYIVYLDPPRGAKWMVMSATKQSLRVQTPPLGGCWYIYKHGMTEIDVEGMMSCLD